MRFST